ncbi:hypothetical protein GH784_23360 [Agrobacterium sp. CNPSo 675]|nr:hypothetical protein [Agrobacterium tumefaciens]
MPMARTTWSCIMAAKGSGPNLSPVNTIVLLPGLDGTGLLLGDFARALESDFKVVTIVYPPEIPMGYDDLMAFIRPQLPDTSYIIVGESFSGPLALQLAFKADERLQGVVLGASFARVDIRAKWLLKILVRAVSPRLVPMRLLTWMLLGKSTTPTIEQQLRGALCTVSASVLSRRANSALTVDMTEQGHRITCPVLYLRATQDRLISRAAGADVARIAQRLTIEDISAPHFLFQVAPDECAAAIRKFAGSIDRS